ncbi:MAG: glutaredoxin family protein [bacterium]
MRHTVTLLTRVQCHLCDDARAALDALATEIEFDLEVLDVDADPDRQDRFGDRVPVVLLDGREHGYWRVETERLRASLLR